MYIYKNKNDRDKKREKSTQKFCVFESRKFFLPLIAEISQDLFKKSCELCEREHD